jgi:hypothetical protein
MYPLYDRRQETARLPLLDITARHIQLTHPQRLNLALLVMPTLPASSGCIERPRPGHRQSPKHGDAKARLVEDLGQADTADGQRQGYLTRLPSGECDVAYLDVIYVPEFASKNLLRDMTSYVDGRGGTDTFTQDMMKRSPTTASAGGSQATGRRGALLPLSCRGLRPSAGG